MNARLRDEYRTLYYLVLGMLGFVVVTALGGGLFGQQGPWFSQWQHQAFQMLCHQVPERSFHLGGQPMAVCSRCIGVYASLASGWLLIPAAVSLLTRAGKFAKPLLLTAVFINLIDIIGNVANFWENTLASRFAMGALLGLGVVIVMGHYFTTRKQKAKGNTYGTDRAV